VNNLFSIEGAWITQDSNIVLYVVVLISHIEGQKKCWHILYFKYVKYNDVGEDAVI